MKLDNLYIEVRDRVQPAVDNQIALEPDSRERFMAEFRNFVKENQTKLMTCLSSLFAKEKAQNVVQNTQPIQGNNSSSKGLQLEKFKIPGDV